MLGHRALHDHFGFTRRREDAKEGKKERRKEVWFAQRRGGAEVGVVLSLSIPPVIAVIASAARQSRPRAASWIAALRSQ
jgi:hypothetical protein